MSIALNKEKQQIKPEDNYLGIPRRKIPWYPSIDYKRCNSCKTCVEFCKLKTFSFNEKESKVFVSKPYNCIVSCNGCQEKCPENAISFPSTRVIDDVRKKYRV
jgi:NAD-dependent dihydropyrimidine dehydrogenase PreA subunit